MSVVTTTLTSESVVIGADVCQLTAMDIRREVNRIPRANLVLSDGDAAESEFVVSNSGHFAPGKEIEIKLRYEDEPESESTVFKGLVMRHNVSASNKSAYLSVELKDAAVKLTKGRKSAVFIDQADSQIIEQLVEAAGLKKGIIDATRPTHAHIVQYHCTDWDFILSRAEAQGLLVSAEDGKLSVRSVDLTKPAKRTHQFKYGENIYDLEFSLDAEEQCQAVNTSAWNIKENKMTKPRKAASFVLAQGDLNGEKIARDVGFQPRQLLNQAPLAPEELQDWANGQLMRSRLSMIRGTLSVKGLADIKLLDTIAIDGIGKHFNGNTVVTGICHRIDGNNGWFTDIQFGLSARSFALTEDIQEAPAAGLLPGVNGLHIAIVDNFEEDPDKQFRVKVILPTIGEKDATLWARLASPDAGNGRGWFFRPEPGDEVIVGFFNNDPRQPVILGALFSPTNQPPKQVADKNPTKAIVSKTGSMIGFTDEEKGLIFIETAEGASMVIDDDAKSFEFCDQNGNQFKMNDSGISLKSAKDFKLEASGNVVIKGAKVDIK